MVSASRHGSVSELEEILSRPQDPNNRFVEFPEDFPPLGALSPLSPLQMAANFGELEAMRLLLEARADIGPAHCRITSLIYLRQHRSLDAMKLLLEARADAGNALSTAAALGKAGAVQVLLESGVEKDLEDNHGVTPLLEACWSGHAHVVHLLLAAGAQPAACSKKGICYLSARRRRGLAQIPQMSIQLPADLVSWYLRRLRIPRLFSVSRWSRARRRVATHQLAKPRSK